MEEWKKWYSGGIWDGDGTFGISKHYIKIWVTYQPFAAITLCDPKAEKVFELLESEFGFKCVWKSRGGNPKWKIAHRWILSSQCACDFAKTLEPFLLIKKERAQILMEWPKKKQGYKTMTKEERDTITQKQEELYQRMKILNKRGT